MKKFTLEGQFIASADTHGSGRLQFDAPYAIAYNGTNNKVYVCDTNNHRITILNHDLPFMAALEAEEVVQDNSVGQMAYQLISKAMW